MIYGVITGTGVRDVLDSPGEPHAVQTPYGEVSVSIGMLGAAEVAYLNRHGPQGYVPPHQVNYRGNIFALRSLGVERVLAAASVGGLTEHLKPGHFVLLNQFLDFTKARALTFYDAGNRPPVHVDVSEPYCPGLRGDLMQSGDPLGERLHVAATYLCTEGPRFETPAEIAMFRRLDADVVGMTGVPEVVLAREASMCYGCVAIVTNWAAGIAPDPVEAWAVADAMRANTQALRELFARAIELGLGRTDSCSCRELGGADWPP